MSRNRIRLPRLIALLSITAFTLAGCGLVSSSGSFRTAELPDGQTPLAGVDVTVTSKNFSESILLGKITATYLSAAGANVTDMTNAPGSMSSRQAQLNGDADMLWEYTGTGWVNYHAQTETIPDPQELWQRLRAVERKDNNLEWLAPAQFNNTYAFAMSQATSQRLGITTLSEIGELPVNERTFCVNEEFYSRADGMQPMLAAYDIPLGTPDGVPLENVTQMDAGVVYTSTARSSPCNFGMVYTTDGRIKNLDLQILEDDRKFFLPYSGCLVVRRDFLAAHPQLEALIAPLSRDLTDDLMQDLNGRIDIDGEDPADVAYDWLQNEGLIR